MLLLYIQSDFFFFLHLKNLSIIQLYSVLYTFLNERWRVELANESNTLWYKR